jgi:3-oxoacyl-[acyl-carrier protein] reductase
VGRWGTPQEFGDVACFLASDRARYVTGTTVVVDGGLSRGLF